MKKAGIFFIITRFVFVLSITPFISYAQYGFVKEIPFSKLALDTPYTFEKLGDFFEVIYKENGIPDTVIKCSVNKNGDELLRIAKSNDFDSLIDHKSIRKYNSKGLLQSFESHYPFLKENSKILYTYNNKNQLIKADYFAFRTIEKLKPGAAFPNKNSSTGFTIVGGSTLDTNFYFQEKWVQENVWIYNYDNKGNITELFHIDQFNETEKIVSYYDKNEKLILKETFAGRCYLKSKADPNATSDTVFSFQEWKTQRDTFHYFSGGYCINSELTNSNMPYEQIIDSVFTDVNNRIVLEKWYRRKFDDSKPDQVFYLIKYNEKKIEYDKYNRKSKQTYISDDGNSEEHFYYYKNPSKIDLIKDVF